MEGSMLPKKESDGGWHYLSVTLCHLSGADAKGLPTKIAPSLVDNPGLIFRGSKDTTIRILLHGLTGPVNGKKYPTDMPPMGPTMMSGLHRC